MPHSTETPQDQEQNPSEPNLIADAEVGASVLHFATEELPPIKAVYRRICGRISSEPDANNEVLVVCPFHDDSEPSLHLNVVTNIFNCFVCEKGGGVLQFVAYAEGFTRLDRAAQWLIEKRLMLPRSRDVWSGANVTIYDYHDAHGLLLYQVGRRQLSATKKTFIQRQLKPNGTGWVNDIKGVLRVPYRLPEVLTAAASCGTIYVVEGEKDADNLRAALLAAGVAPQHFAVTTNSGGSGWRWPASWADHFRSAARVVVLADNDEAGTHAAQYRASICALAVPETRLIGALPGLGVKGDVTDWLSAGHHTDELEVLIAVAPRAAPYSENYPRHAVPDLLENCNDTGNAHWFLAAEGETTRFIYDENVWRTWDGQRWTDEADRNAQTAAERAQRAMKLAVADLNSTERDLLEFHAHALGGMQARKHMIEAATAIPALQMFSCGLDTHMMKLNLQNGVFDFETFTMSPHDPSLWFTEVSPLAYDPAATCPRWENWIYKAMECDSARVEYVQRLMGEMLIGKPQRRRLFYAYGPAGTGKSTITHVMHEILGKFAEGIDFASVAMRDKTGGDRPRPDLVCLRGKRLITAVESRQNDRLDAARLKQVVGGDLMSVRNLYKGQVTFAIQAVIFLSGNERPIIDAGDDFWPKFKVLPFKYAFPHQDVNFFDRVLCPELVGILTWCVEGLRKLIAGDWVLIDPPAVVAETAEYRADENRLAPFFAEMCELDPLFKSKPTALWDAYTAWFASHNNSIGRGMMGDRTFYAKLVSDSRITRLPLSHGVRSYGGIRVRPDVQTALDSGAYDARRIQRSAGNSGSQEPDF